MYVYSHCLSIKVVGCLQEGELQENRVIRSLVLLLLVLSVHPILKQWRAHRMHSNGHGRRRVWSGDPFQQSLYTALPHDGGEGKWIRWTGSVLPIPRRIWMSFSSLSTSQTKLYNICQIELDYFHFYWSTSISTVHQAACLAHTLSMISIKPSKSNVHQAAYLAHAL